MCLVDQLVGAEAGVFGRQAIWLLLAQQEFWLPGYLVVGSAGVFGADTEDAERLLLLLPGVAHQARVG